MRLAPRYDPIFSIAATTANHPIRSVEITAPAIHSPECLVARSARSLGRYDDRSASAASNVFRAYITAHTIGTNPASVNLLKVPPLKAQTIPNDNAPKMTAHTTAAVRESRRGRDERPVSSVTASDDSATAAGPARVRGWHELDPCPHRCGHPK